MRSLPLNEMLAQQATPRATRGTAEARVAPWPWGFASVSRAEQTRTIWPLHCLNLLVFLSRLSSSSTLSRLFFSANLDARSRLGLP